MNAGDPSQPSAMTGSAAGVSPRALLATCVAAALKGAEVIRSREGTRAALEWESKSPTDFVSAVDRASEEAIAEIVRSRHPDVPLVGEELSPDAAMDGLVFVADPLDGTTNYLHGFPFYAVSIAAAIDGQPVAGAVVNVPTGELFTATAGGGARRNGQPISVSSITEPSRALLGTGFPFKHEEQVDPYLRSMREIMRHAAGIRRPGSAALDLCEVACGRFDGFWEPMLAPWDIAAGILLVREAGGLVTTYDGQPVRIAHTQIVAGNPAMHGWLLERLRA